MPVLKLTEAVILIIMNRQWFSLAVLYEFPVSKQSDTCIWFWCYFTGSCFIWQV